MLEAYKAFWKNSFDFKGRTRRADFWLAGLANVLAALAFFIISLLFIALVGDFAPVVPSIILPVFVVATIVPSISIEARRLRDAGFSPWFLLLTFVPYVGLVLFIMFLQPSKAVVAE